MENRYKLAFKLYQNDDSFFKKIIYSDESVFSLSGNYGRVRVWRHKNTRYEKKNIVTKEKYGGGKSVMVWSCMTAKGVSDLVFCDEKVDKLYYLRILKRNFYKQQKNTTWTNLSYNRMVH